MKFSILLVVSFFILHLVKANTCETATLTKVNNIETGSTKGGFIANLGSCVKTASTSGVNWYTFIGDGNTWTIETVKPTEGLPFDTQLWVFKGNCKQLSCVTENDESKVGIYSLVTFKAMLGVTYFVAVGGYASNEGNYKMLISNDANPRKNIDIISPLTYKTPLYFKNELTKERKITIRTYKKSNQQANINKREEKKNILNGYAKFLEQLIIYQNINNVEQLSVLDQR